MLFNTPQFSVVNFCKTDPRAQDSWQRVHCIRECLHCAMLLNSARCIRALSALISACIRALRLTSFTTVRAYEH
jgi:hypothetical protein